MTISNGHPNQNITLFPLAQPATRIPLGLDNPYGEEECAQPLLIIEQIRGFQEPSKDQFLSQFLADIECIEYPQYF